MSRQSSAVCARLQSSAALAALAAILFAAGGTGAAEPACPGQAAGEPIRPTVMRSEFFLRLIPGTIEEIDRACSSPGALSRQRAVGCSKFDVATNTLTVWFLEPQAVNDVRTCVLGHEVLHGARGAYHW